MSTEYWNADGDELTDYDLGNMYDDALDETWGDAEVAGCTFATSRALRELDPVAYRTGFNDWLDAQIRDGDVLDVDPIHESWAAFDESEGGTDEITHEAELTCDDRGYLVEHWHADVGQVSTTRFDDAESARAWLMSGGYTDIT